MSIDSKGHADAGRRKRILGVRLVVAVSFAVLLLLMLTLTAIGVIYMDRPHRQVGASINSHVTKVELISQMYRAARERTVSLHRLVLVTDPSARDDQWMQFNHYGAEFTKARIALEATNLNPREQALLAEQAAQTRVARPLQKEVTELIFSQRSAEARALLISEAIPAQDRVIDTLNLLREYQERGAKDGVQRVRTDYQAARILTLVVSGALILIALGIVIAVTRETRNSDRALRREKERAQTTLFSIGDGVIRTDGHGRVEYLNPVAERMLGWWADMAIGLPLTDIFNIVHDTTNEPAVNPVSQTLNEGVAVSGAEDLMLVSRNGDRYAVELTASPIQGEVGNQRGAVLVFRDVTEMRVLAREVRYQATHDILTGLANRIKFERRVTAELEVVRELGDEGALCFIDLDLFKVVNDTCGHLAGDELLRQLSALIRKSVRGSDLLARIGGDEFAIVLSDCPLERAERIANEVRAAIRSIRFVWEDNAFEIGASVGVVPITAASGTLNDVMRAADFACQQAKTQGRNCVVVLRNDRGDGGDSNHINWAHLINQGINRDQFSLFGQWIKPLDEASNSGWHCEVLLRMIDADGNLLSPNAFLPAAERYHLMPQVDRWMISEVFRRLTDIDWGRQSEPDQININLSGQSLCDPDMLEYVITELERSRIPPQRLCFEVTETAAVANLTSATEFIAALKQVGCRFALDDFGSGLSSFSYLKNMKVDYLKIDGTFVRNIVTDATDLAMIKSIHEVAQSMGIETVAEYVENVQIEQQLQALGVNYAQGYAIARPAPLEEVLIEAAAPGGVQAMPRRLALA